MRLRASMWETTMSAHVRFPGIALLFLMFSLVSAPFAFSGTTQTIAAGTSQTNLPTESVWPGAQNPPYICCWISQGQFVTFTFAVSGGSTDLALRYSAGKTVATRTIEIDGVVAVANQSFAHTASWSTW